MINIRERQIAICTPVYRYTTPDFTSSLLKTNRALQGVSLRWLNLVGEPNCSHARNILVAEALKCGATDIVFIDDDIGWEPEGFLRLFEVPDECLVTAGAPQRRQRTQVSFCSNLDPENPRQLGRLISGYAATAFTRIQTKLFTQLRYPVAYQYPQGTCKSWFFHDIAALGSTSQGKGFIASDYYFSKKCKEEGVEVWIDPTIKLRHHSSIALTAVMADSLQA